MKRVTTPRLAAAAAALLLHAGIAHAEATLEGHWEGAITLPTGTLDFDLDFTQAAGEWTGDISIPAQGAKDLPLTAIALDGTEATFAIKGIPGDPTFNGTIDSEAGTITGKFTQGGGSFDFEAKSGENMVERAITALADVDADIERAMEGMKGAGLAIGVVVDGELVFAKGFGYRDIASETPVTTKTLFAIGSCTKAFTTFALARLVDRGELDWDKPVVDYMPQFRLMDNHATLNMLVRDLVTHRSGLPRHDMVWYNNEDLSRADLVARLRHLEPNKQLRETFQYNNLMYLAAGHLTEILTGKSWEDAVRDEVLRPLGMNDTVFSVEEMQQAEDFALPYNEDDDQNLDLIDFRPINVMGPAGSINSNVEDMANWMRVHLDKGTFNDEEILKPTSIQQLHSPQVTIGGIPEDREMGPASYSLGWMVMTYHGHYEVQHGGNIDGYSALVTLYPREGIGIVALANKNGTGIPHLASRHIADRLLDVKKRDWIGEALQRRALAIEMGKEADEKKDTARIAGTSPSHGLDGYEGTYKHAGYGTVTITEVDGALLLRSNQMDLPLEHWHFDTFRVAENDDEIIPEGLELNFYTDPSGSVGGFRGMFEPSVKAIEFLRQPDSRMTDPAHLAKLAGKYSLAGQTITFHLRGTTLFAHLPGQPEYELEASASGDFPLKGLSGFSVRFTLEDGDDHASEATFLQPNGVFTAERIEEDEE